MQIRAMLPEELPQILPLWNQAVEAGEVVYRPLTTDYFAQKFCSDPNYDGAYSLVALEEGKIVGFINGVCKRVFLDKETNANTPGFITCIFVDKAHRRRGVGRALVNALGAAFQKAGKTVIACRGGNPINLDWIVPGTPGHDHNNAPGVDENCPGYAFLQAIGFTPGIREIAMYLNLADYQPLPDLKERQAQLLEQGVYTGRYDPQWDCGYDGMCDRVGSEYWRSVIRTEIACHKAGQPCRDVRFIPNGKIPAGPRPMLVAVHQGQIAAFTGPVDKQDSGRGWFAGICTDPLYERRGIASVLFHLLMQEFIAEGASFSTLFTGDSNHAQRIYLRAGFRIAKGFVEMDKPLA